MSKVYGTCQLLKDGVWRVDAEPHVLMMLKRMFPGETRKTHGHVRMADTEENCRNLHWFISRYPLETDPADRLEEQAIRHRDQVSSLHALISGRKRPLSFDLHYPAREYQRVAADMLLRAGGLLCADDMGLGKTVVSICTMTDARTRPHLVVTLTALTRQWRDKIEMFAPGLQTVILEKGTPYEYRRVGGRKKNRNDIGPDPDVIIMTYSKLAGWADTLGIRGFLKGITFDEIQELRHIDSEKYRAAKHISEKCSYRLGLSGTPVYNWGIEIWNVLDVLRPNALGFRKEFIEEWCTKEAEKGEDPSKVSDKPRIKDPKAFGSFAREQGFILRRTREDVGRELPQLLRHHQIVDCEESALDAIAGSAVELAKIILAQGQVRRGAKFLAAEEFSNELRQATGIGKAPHVAALARMIIESGENLVLYGWHHAVYDIWEDMLTKGEPKIKVVRFTGRESSTQKDAALKAFAKREAQVLIMSLRSGAGVDGLQATTRTGLFGELDWSPGVHAQCETRFHRDGQKQKSFAYYAVAETGADPIIADVLGLKRVQLTGILDPGAVSMGAVQDTGESNIRRLAEAYLRQRGGGRAA